MELAGGEEGQVVPGVGYQGVDDQARVPGYLALGGVDDGGNSLLDGIHVFSCLQGGSSSRGHAFC